MHGEHSNDWEGASVIDRARRSRELMLKEALHIQMTPAEERFNRDGGLEIPGCWIAALKTLRAGLVFASSRPPVTCILSVHGYK